MEVRATAKYIRVQPRKVRIIADEIRGKNCGHAAALLHHHTSKGAKALRKVLINAVANAVENNGLAPENLKIAAIMVDQGPVLKRMTAKAMGRGARILKKTSHITVVVEDAEPEVTVRPHGAKAKPRPTFAVKGTSRPQVAQSVATPNETIPAPVEEPPVDPGTEPQSPVEEPTPVPTDETPVEATPVEASDAPEEGGEAAPIETSTEAPKAEAADEENNA